MTTDKAAPAAAQPATWPAGLLDRIEAAMRRIEDGHAPRRIPADPTDVDLVLAECKAMLTGKTAPFWLDKLPREPAPPTAQDDAPAAAQPEPVATSVVSRQMQTRWREWMDRFPPHSERDEIKMFSAWQEAWITGRNDLIDELDAAEQDDARQPLTREDIDAAYAAHDMEFPWVSSHWSFEAGVRWAEQMHGIAAMSGKEQG